MRIPVTCLFLAACWLGLAARASAHDIPSDITVQLFVKPAGSRLIVLARVPLKAVRDVDFPERDGGYLDLARLAPLLPGAAKLWITESLAVRENDRPLGDARIAATRISLESDRSFASFETALAHLDGPPLPGASRVVWEQVMFDARMEYPIRSDRSRFSVRPAFYGLAEHVVTVLRFVPPGGEVRAYEFTQDPGLVPLDQGWSQAALRFVALGFSHILDGTDHLLFLLCLVMPLRRVRPLLAVVTAFTVAHSFTLIASAYGMVPRALWFPPLIETLIAASIVCMALENIAGARQRRRWLIAFAFGLVHGFGFSLALRDSLQFAGSHLLASLLSFNIGVELGQLLVLLLLLPTLGALFRYVVEERTGTIILSALVAHTGWHWMLERGAVLRRFHLPAFDAAQIAGGMRWLLAVLLIAGALGFLFRLLRRGPAGAKLPDAAARPQLDS